MIGAASRLYRRFSGGGALPPGWAALKSYPFVAEVWNPDEGVTIGTGVSDWEGCKNGTVASEAVLTQQPAFNAVGSCPSGAPSLSFTAASLQKLVATAFPSGFAAVNADDYRYYVFLRWLNLAAIQACASFGDGSAVIVSNVYVSTSGAIAHQVYDGVSHIPNVAAAITANVDTWVYGGSNATNTLVGERVNGDATATPGNLTGIDLFSIGCRRFNAATIDRFSDAEVYGVVVTNRDLSAVEASQVAASANAIMGL